MMCGVLWLATVVFAVLATRWLRRYALTHSIMDIPNDRSSHAVPTPRGGGLAIVLAFLGVLLLLYGYDLVSGSVLFALLGAGALTAALGFWDDHGGVPVRWRLLGHFVAAGWGLYWLSGPPPVLLSETVFDLGYVGMILAALYLVWLLNLYNFMDGIDGIAGVETVTVCSGAALLYFIEGHADQAWPPLMLAGAAFGFLCWNFPPAKIFMGDVGSGFLGLVLGLLSIHAGWISPEYLWSWLILMGVFIVDATFTLLRRLLRGERVYQAHRSHAYQQASRYYGGHLPVTVMVGLINCLWLWPMAVWVGTGGVNALAGLVLAYVPLIVLAMRFRAGCLEQKQEDSRHFGMKD